MLLFCPLIHFSVFEEEKESEKRKAELDCEQIRNLVREAIENVENNVKNGNHHVENEVENVPDEVETMESSNQNRKAPF